MTICVAYCVNDEAEVNDLVAMIGFACNGVQIIRRLLDDGNTSQDVETIKLIKDCFAFVLVYSKHTQDTWAEQATMALKASNKQRRMYYHSRNNTAKSKTKPDEFKDKGFEIFSDLQGLTFRLKELCDEFAFDIQEVSSQKEVERQMRATLHPNRLCYLRFSLYKDVIACVDNLQTAFDDGAKNSEGQENALGDSANAPRQRNAVASFLRGVNLTCDAQRLNYDRICERLIDNMALMSEVFAPSRQRELIRAVYDVAAGAFFIYECKAAYFLCGITVDQYNVSESDSEMNKLSKFIIEKYH
jgi:hypothetical protein